MLDATLELRDGNGQLLASADTASLGESLTSSLPAAGTYYLIVRSKGNYGDLGQYSISGTLPQEPVYVTGDADMDGDVDLADLGLISSNFGKSQGAIWSEGDFDGDGDIDLADLGLLSTYYGAGTSTVSTS